MHTQFTGGTRILLKHLAAWGIPLGLLAVFAMPAAANNIGSAAVSVDCKNSPKTATVTICGASLDCNGGAGPFFITYSLSFNGTTVVSNKQTQVYPPPNNCITDTVTLPRAVVNGDTLTGSTFLTFCGQNSQTVTFMTNVSGCPPPPPNLCTALGAASNYAALGLQGSTINLSSGPLCFVGNVGIGENGLFNFSGGGKVNGELDADPTSHQNISGGGTTITGGIHTMSMSAVESAALAESDNAANPKLNPPTQTFNSITSATTIKGNGGQNVIQVNGLVHLSGGQNLTISGGPSDIFIINITQGLQLDGGANIVLQGGVCAGSVLFNFPGSGDQIQTSGNANTAGIFLAPSRVIQINGGFHNSEFISGKNLSFQSNPQVCQPCPACHPCQPCH
jgi:hypothetical protein